VVVVSRSLAQRFWPGQDPIGKHLSVVGDTGRYTVVGVAGENRFRSLRDATPMAYFSYRQFYWQGDYAIRTTGDVKRIIPAIRSAVTESDPKFSLWFVRTMDEYLTEPLSQPRLSAFLMSAFGLVALILAAIGLYGIMDSAVREQRRELGVRMALGATPGRVERDVLGRALAVSLSGAGVGLVGALIAARLVRALLFQVSPSDPIALFGACATLLGVALIAAYLPARHASHIDPARALKAE
jgi:putative ABC transport system permease protein